MHHMKIFVVIVTLLFMLPPLSPALAAKSDLELTWLEAMVAVPKKKGDEIKMGKMKSNDAKDPLKKHRKEPLPVIVYLHGCAGFEKTDKKAIKALAKGGYIVVAPDSMARKFRPSQCSTGAKSGGANPFVFDFRMAEISYALQQLSRSEWADFKNLFVVGVSEGAVAVAHYRGDYFRARVMTQWTCQGSPLVRGLSAPPATPFLAVVQKNDPWYNQEGSKQAGDCGSFFDPASGSRSIVLDDGKKHTVMKEEEILGEIIRFFDQHRTAF